MSSLTSKAKDGWARWKLAHFYMRDLQDVDVSTTLPVDGDTLVWVDADKKWEPDSGAGVRGMPLPAKDLFTASATPSLNYSLTALPLTSSLGSSVILSLNGLIQVEGTDYTVDYTTGIVTLAVAPVHLDVIYAEYWTTLGSATPVVSSVTEWSVGGNKAVNVSTVDAVAMIDAGTAFTDIAGDLTPGSGEADLVFASNGPLTPTEDGSFLFLRSGGSGGLWRFERISGVDTDTQVTAIGALASAGTFSVTASGSTLTIKQGLTTIATVTLGTSDAARLAQTYVGVRGTHGTSSSIDNFTAQGGTVADAFNRPDSDTLGTADTGQTWLGNR